MISISLEITTFLKKGAGEGAIPPMNSFSRAMSARRGQERSNQGHSALGSKILLHHIQQFTCLGPGHGVVGGELPVTAGENPLGHHGLDIGQCPAGDISAVGEGGEVVGGISLLLEAAQHGDGLGPGNGGAGREVDAAGLLVALDRKSVV